MYVTVNNNFLIGLLICVMKMVNKYQTNKSRMWSLVNKNIFKDQMKKANLQGRFMVFSAEQQFEGVSLDNVLKDSNPLFHQRLRIGSLQLNKHLH